MAIIDIGILAILVIFLILGLRKGFISEFFQAVGLIAAIMLAVPLGVLLADIFVKYFEDYRSTVAFVSDAIAFVLVYLIFVSIGAILSKIEIIPGVTMLNRTFGAIFCSIKGFLMVVIIFAILRAIPQTELLLKSQISPDKLTIEDIVDAIPQNTLDSLTALAKDSLDLESLKEQGDKEKIIQKFIEEHTPQSTSSFSLSALAYDYSRLLDPIIIKAKLLIPSFEED